MKSIEKKKNLLCCKKKERKEILTHYMTISYTKKRSLLLSKLMSVQTKKSSKLT